MTFCLQRCLAELFFLRLFASEKDRFKSRPNSGRNQNLLVGKFYTILSHLSGAPVQLLLEGGAFPDGVVHFPISFLSKQSVVCLEIPLPERVWSTRENEENSSCARRGKPWISVPPHFQTKENLPTMGVMGLGSNSIISQQMRRKSGESTVAGGTKPFYLNAAEDEDALELGEDHTTHRATQSLHQRITGFLQRFRRSTAHERVERLEGDFGKP